MSGIMSSFIQPFPLEKNHMGKLLLLRGLNTKYQHQFPSKACALARTYQDSCWRKAWVPWYHPQRWKILFLEEPCRNTDWRRVSETLLQQLCEVLQGRYSLVLVEATLFPLGSVCRETTSSPKQNTFALLNRTLYSSGNLLPDVRNNEIC